MKRRKLGAVILVLVMLTAANVFAVAGETNETPLTITFEENGVTSNSVTYNVVLTRDAGSDAEVSFIDIHLAVTGKFESFTATDGNGVLTTWDAANHTLRLYRIVLGSTLEFPPSETASSIVLGTLTLSADGEGEVGLAQAGDYETEDFVASDGITSPGYQDSLLRSVGTAEYTFPQGVTVSGQVKNYNPNNATTITLYAPGDRTTTLYSATIATETGSGQKTQSFSFPAVAAGTYDLVVTKPGQLTYTVTGVVVGSEDLDLTAATGKAYSTMTMLAGDVNGDGSITEDDVTIIRYTTNINKTTSHPGVTIAADVNGDGSITEDDVTIVRYTTHINKNANHSTYAY